MHVTKGLQEAIAQGYVVVRGTQKREGRYVKVIPTANNFMNWCEKSGAPYVEIYLKTKYASVEIDLIANSYRLNAAGVEAMTKAMLPEYRTKHRVRSWMVAGEVFNYLEKVPIDKAVEVAKAFVAIASNPDHQQPSRERP